MVFICLVSFVLLTMLITGYMNIYTKPVVSNPVTSKSNEVMYLSDIPYVKEQSNVGWGSITIDQNVEKNDMISLIVNGKKKYFLKGIGAHATSLTFLIIIMIIFQLIMVLMLDVELLVMELKFIFIHLLMVKIGI